MRLCGEERSIVNNLEKYEARFTSPFQTKLLSAGQYSDHLETIGKFALGNESLRIPDGITGFYTQNFVENDKCDLLFRVNIIA